jgi:competence protein ComEA
MKPWQNILLGMFLGVTASAAIYLIAIPPRGDPIQLGPLPTLAPIQVYVTGEIVHPGVFTLPSNSRVQDAITAAGGFKPDANPSAVNLAARLQDEDRVIVPSKTEILDIGDPSGSQPLININTATSNDLQNLPGIGSARADAIISYRSKQGLFKSTQELLSVPGLYPSIFEKIKDLITVGP